MQETLKTMISDLSKYIDTRTVFGEPFTVGKVTLVPVIRVAFGLGSGGGAASGGGGAGAKLTPLAVIVIKDEEVSVHTLSRAQPEGLAALADVIPEAAGKWAKLLSQALSKSEPGVETGSRQQESSTTVE